MSGSLTLIQSNLQVYDPQEHRNKPLALGFSCVKTGAVMAFVHLLGQKNFLSIKSYGKKSTVQWLNIILSLKEAYLRDMGQPIGFDFSQINCDVGTKVAAVDHPFLDGQEFQIPTANIY